MSERTRICGLAAGCSLPSVDVPLFLYLPFSSLGAFFGGVRYNLTPSAVGSISSNDVRVFFPTTVRFPRRCGFPWLGSLFAARGMNNDNHKFLTPKWKTGKKTDHHFLLHIRIAYTVEHHTANVSGVGPVSRRWRIPTWQPEGVCLS